MKTLPACPGFALWMGGRIAKLSPEGGGSRAPWPFFAAAGAIIAG